MSVFKKEFEDEVLRLYSYDEKIKEYLETDDAELGLSLLYSRSRMNEKTINRIEAFYNERQGVHVYSNKNNKMHKEQNCVQIPDARVLSTLQIRLERACRMYLSGECYKDRDYARSKFKCPIIFELNNGFTFSDTTFCSFYNCPENLSSIDECPGAVSGDCWKKYDDYQRSQSRSLYEVQTALLGGETLCK